MNGSATKPMRSRIRKNDTVMVIAGKERGKTGKVLKVDSAAGRVVVEHLNMVKRHLKPQGTRGGGGIVEKEAPLHISRVMLMCERCNAPVRVGVRRTKDGAAIRVCKRCKEDIDH